MSILSRSFLARDCLNLCPSVRGAAAGSLAGGKLRLPLVAVPQWLRWQCCLVALIHLL